MRLRILILSQHFPPEIGAAPLRTGMIATTLRRLGCEVEVITAVPNYPQGRILPEFRGRLRFREVRDDGVIVHRHWVYGAQGAGLKRFLSFLSFSASACLAIGRIRKPDLILVQSPPPTVILPAVLMKVLYRSGLVFHVADLWPDTVKRLGHVRNPIILGLAYALEKFCYRVADGVNGVTEGIVACLRDEKHVPADRLQYVPNCIDLETFQPMEPDRDLAGKLGLDGCKVFLLAGTFNTGSGLEILPRVAQLLRDDPAIHLYLVGDGPAKPSLRAMVAELGLTNVTIAEPVPAEQVPRLYSIAVAGLCTMRKNDFFQNTRPARILPAMACGRAVVYSAAGEGADLVRRENAGLVVPAEEPEALAAAIRALAADPALAARLGANGRRYAVEHLSWERTLGGWLRRQQEGAGGSALP